MSGTATLKASTVRFYTANLARHVRPLRGGRPATSLTRANCRELIATSRAKGLKVNTVRGIAHTLSALLSQAVNKLPANPALRLGRYLRRGDEPKALIQPLTRAEAAHLVGVARVDFPRWYAWLRLTLRQARWLKKGQEITVDTYGHFNPRRQPRGRRST